MSEPINVVRFQNKVRAFFGMRGSNPVPTLAELVPGVIVETDRPEWGYAGLEPRWISRNNSSAGVAGQLSSVGIYNPPDSSVLVVVEGLVNSSASSSQNCQIKIVRPNPAPTFLSNVPVNGCIDTGFLPADGASQAQMAAHEVSFVAAGGLGSPATPLGFFPSLASTQEADHAMLHPFRPLAILRPGGLILLEGTVANLAVSGFFYGRERAQERGVPS